MISVTDNFKNAAKAPVKMVKAELIFDDETISSEDDLISLNLEETGFFWSCVTKCNISRILGVDRSLVGKTFSAKFLIVTDMAGDVWEECPLGTYIVYEQTVDLEKGVTSIKAYDYIGHMGLQKYQENELIYNVSVSNLATQIATKFGLTISIDPSLPNTSYVVAEDLYKNLSSVTYRDILAEIAGATSSIVCSNSSQVYLKPLQTTSQETLTYANLKKFKLEPKYGPINSVVLARTPQEDNIAVVDEESVEEYGLTELKLANNEILDDDRQTLAQPILEAVDGFEFYPFEVATEGHGWYEVGDMISITDGTNTWPVVISSITLTIDGGIKEILKGVAPTETKTNYALAGGTTKSLFNTEIKVDKQNQRIDSIVEEQTELQNQVNNNYTEITQTISSVVTSVQNSGGNNLLKNSAMYSLDDNGVPLSWGLTGSGTITIAPSAEAAVNGSLSRQNISLKNMTATQVVEVKADSSSITEKTYYSFSCKIKKTAPGECMIRISDGTESGMWQIALDNGDTSFYDEHSIEAILPNSSNLTVSVYGSSDAEFSVTDMMLSVGDYKSQWTQANGEFANTQVSIDNNGVTIRSNNLAGTYTKQTPQELSAYANNTLVATINDDGTSAPKAEFTTEIGMSPIKIVPQNDGWAFVRKD